MLVATFLPWGGTVAEDGGGEALLTYTAWEWRVKGEEGSSVDWSSSEMDFVRGKGLTRAGGTVLIAGMSVLLAGALLSIIGFFTHRGVSLIAGVVASLGSAGLLTGSGLLVAGFIRFTDFLRAFADSALSDFSPQWGMIVVVVALGMAVVGSVFLFSTGAEPGRPAAAAEAAAPAASAAPEGTAKGTAWTRLKPSAEVRNLVCPQCKAPVQVPAGAKPACWECGFSG